MNSSVEWGNNVTVWQCAEEISGRMQWICHSITALLAPYYDPATIQPLLQWILGTNCQKCTMSVCIWKKKTVVTENVLCKSTCTFTVEVHMRYKAHIRKNNFFFGECVCVYLIQFNGQFFFFMCEKRETQLFYCSKHSLCCAPVFLRAWLYSR